MTTVILPSPYQALADIDVPAHDGLSSPLDVLAWRFVYYLSKGGKENVRMSREIELLTEIRDLLQVMAEPAIAERDVKLRSSLRSVVGKGKKAISAAKLMDGSHSQSAIAKQAGIDQGNLSRLVKALAAAELIATDQKHPRLLVKVPATFFDGDEADE